ncbi:methyltransferase domain-containing protein [Limtongia smithiae]|uniref:methyltransferase domain-containing protein n=1 Tax=Limtongia smithiae TaxID=1125753 RepID=UPI0034CE5963
MNSFPLPPAFANVDDYVTELADFYNSPFVQLLAGKVHIINFLLPDNGSDLLETTVPPDWLAFFDAANIDDILDALIFFKPSPDGMPSSLQTFLDTVKTLSIDRHLSESGELNSHLPGLRASALSLGMSPKKLHECQHLSTAVAEVCRRAETRYVVDLGSGKGYLSRTLAHEYDCAVIAVDSVGSRTRGAERLDELYGARSGGPKLQNAKATPGSLIHLQKNIQSGNLSEIVEKSQLQGEKIVLVGLHTCGNLSHHALRSFAETKEIHAVAVVGCCYNLMTERAVEHDDVGFPMSKRFESLSLSLPTSSRMLACQAPATWTRETRENFFTRHFYRALLQRILKDRGIIDLASGAGDRISIGSLRKQWYADFETYCRGACHRAAQSCTRPESANDELFNVPKDVAVRYYKSFIQKRRRLCVLWTLMACTVAPLTEAIIHLDRYYFLKEQGAREIQVSVVFDQQISARNLLVTGIR